MVCSLGSGRMGAMARLLAAGSSSQTIPARHKCKGVTKPTATDHATGFSNEKPHKLEEVGNQRLIGQYIYRELHEADEANLLDEEDMHVFDSKPMVDPLHLVCCNSCKKPIKASQYAAHTEICWSLCSKEVFLGVDGGRGHKKPSRKERKKLPSTYVHQGTVQLHERLESIEADESVAPVSTLDEQVGMAFSSSMEAIRNFLLLLISCLFGSSPLLAFLRLRLRNSACVQVASVMDNSGVCSGITGHSDVVVPPTTPSKLISAEGLLLSDDIETAPGVIKVSQKAYTGRDFPRGQITGSERPCDVVGHHKPGKVQESCQLRKDVPVPLATKTYYSQRNYHLRSAVSLMYYKALTKEHCSEVVSPNLLQGGLMLSQAASSKNFLLEQLDDQPKDNVDIQFLPRVQNPEHILTQSSEVFLDKSGDCPPPSMNLSNNFPVNNVIRSHTAPVDMSRSKYLPKPYSFAGNSGTQLRTTQQSSNGSVSVT